MTGVDMDKSAHSGAGVQRSTMSLTDMRKKSVRLKAGASLLDGEGLSRPGKFAASIAASLYVWVADRYGSSGPGEVTA